MNRYTKITLLSKKKKKGRMLPHGLYIMKMRFD